VQGGDLDLDMNNLSHINLYFADSNLILRMIMSCPQTYPELLQTPVRILELKASDLRLQSPRPMLTFAAFHRAFRHFMEVSCE